MSRWVIAVCVAVLATCGAQGQNIEQEVWLDKLYQAGRFEECLRASGLVASDTTELVNILQAHRLGWSCALVLDDSPSMEYHRNQFVERVQHVNGNAPRWLIWQNAMAAHEVYQNILPAEALTIGQGLMEDLEANREAFSQTEVHEIYILASLCLKQSAHLETRQDGLDYERVHELLDQVLEAPDVPAWLRARAYHLKGNTFTDLVHFHRKDSARRASYLTQALGAYDAAVDWAASSHEPRRQQVHSLFTRCLVLGYGGRSNPELIQAYRDAFVQINPAILGGQSVELLHGTRRSVLSMLIHWLGLLEAEIDQHGDLELVTEFSFAVDAAEHIWRAMRSTKGDANSQQHLALYSLIPHVHILKREMYKEAQGVSPDLVEVFRALQTIKYADHSMELGSLQEGASIRDVQEKLAQDEVLIEYFMPRPEIAGLLAIQSDTVVFETWPSTTYQALVDWQVALVDRSTKAQELGVSLFKRLVEPALSPNIRKLIVAPEGPLIGVPVEALAPTDTSRYVLETFEVAYTRSSTYWLAEDSLTEALHGMSYTLKCEREGVPCLPFSDRTHSWLTNTWSFTEMAEDLAPDTLASVFHFASHGSFQEGRTPYPQFEIGAATSSFPEWSIYPKLVVANTCYSGHGRRNEGYGNQGISHQILQRGGAATVVNYWAVDDRSSNEIFQRFYAYLFEGETVQRALHRAKLDYFNEHRDSELGLPYYWAGHLAEGAPLKFSVDLHPSSRKKWWWLGGGALAVLIFAFAVAHVKRRSQRNQP